jgi:hypothetical protein
MEIIAFNLELKDSGFVQCKANADTISSGKNFTVVPMTRVGPIIVPVAGGVITSIIPSTEWLTASTDNRAQGLSQKPTVDQANTVTTVTTSITILTTSLLHTHPSFMSLITEVRIRGSISLAPASTETSNGVLLSTDREKELHLKPTKSTDAAGHDIDATVTDTQSVTDVKDIRSGTDIYSVGGRHAQYS